MENVKEMLKVAKKYRYGIGVEKDEKKADEILKKRFKILQEREDNGGIRSLRKLSIAYERGLGVDKNLNKADELSKKWQFLMKKRTNRRGEK